MIPLVLALLLATAHAEPLLIGAFNIQVFGQSKMDKPDVVDVLIQVRLIKTIKTLYQKEYFFVHETDHFFFVILFISLQFFDRLFKDMTSWWFKKFVILPKQPYLNLLKKSTRLHLIHTGLLSVQELVVVAVKSNMATFSGIKKGEKGDASQLNHNLSFRIMGTCAFFRRDFPFF